MTINVPEIEQANFDRLLAESLARVPIHNPEWTNFNEADPGVTMVQLFAFLTENLLYRSNRIPERNRLKFLQLLGVPLQGATAARGFVTFTNPRGPIQPMTVAADLEVLAGQLPFRTQDGLDVLPLEAIGYVKGPLPAERRQQVETQYRALYASYDVPDAALDFYETRAVEPPTGGASPRVLDLGSDTIDGSLWLALLARAPAVVAATRQAIAGRVLSLGIVPDLQQNARVLRPGGSERADQLPQLVVERPDVRPRPGDEKVVASYRPLETRATGNVMIQPGVVQVLLPEAEALTTWTDLEPLEAGVGQFPPALDETALQDRLVTWIRIRKPSENQGVDPSRITARLSWVGINAARVAQRARVVAERLGTGNGEPHQQFTVNNTPVFPDSVAVTVGGEPWQRIDDLDAAGPEVRRELTDMPLRDTGLNGIGAQRLGNDQPPSKPPVNVFVVDRASGEVRFGSGLRGGRPPRGAELRANYDYGGGQTGNLGIAAINKGPSLPAGIKVTNELPTWGGVDGESVADAERRIAGFLRHRERLVSSDDFAEIARCTPGVDIGRVEVLPLVRPSLPAAVAAGSITLLLVPSTDQRRPEAPSPDRLFLDAVCRHLEPRRLATTELHVRGPDYVPLHVSIGFDVITGRDLAPVRREVELSVRRFLSPLTGGFDGQGWPLEKAVERLEIWAVASRVDGVASVNGVLLASEAGGDVDRMTIAHLELPRLAIISAQAGQPVPLESLRGELPPPETPTRIVPVPVIPPEC